MFKNHLLPYLESLEKAIEILERKHSFDIIAFEPKGFRLTFWNGVPKNAPTPTVQLWNPRTGFLESHAADVNEGLKEVVGKIYLKAGGDDPHVRDLSNHPRMGFVDLIREVSEIGTRLGRNKKRAHTGRHQGPYFSLTLKTFVGHGAVLCFYNPQESFVVHPHTKDLLTFEHKGENMFSSLQEVIALANDHLEFYHPKNLNWQRRFLRKFLPKIKIPRVARTSLVVLEEPAPLSEYLIELPPNPNP